jgi:small subunit ribosomal protein S17
MADQPDDENPTPAQAADDQAPGEQPQAPDVTAEAAGEPEEQEAQAPAAQAPAAQAPAEPEADEAPPAVAPAPAPKEPVEDISPKERRRRARSKHVGDARPARSAEERHAERLLERRAKAVRRRARRLQERARGKGAAPAVAPASDGSEQPAAPAQARLQGKRKVRQGIVVSDRAQKTITVRIDIARPHRRYEKIVRSSSTLHAHDENNDAHEGDVVRVIESRPLSRTKRWTLVDVLERAQ